MVNTQQMPSFYARSLLQWLLLVASFWYSCSAVAAPVVSIDRSVIAKDDTLALTIRSNQGNSSAPDLSPLENNFYVVGNAQSSRFINRNGQSESWTEWQISLIPKRLGRLTIPSLRVNGERTEVLSVSVQPSIPVAAGILRPVYIESEVDSESVYVQQQLIFTLRIFQSVQLDNMNIAEPEFDNAVVEKMGQQSFQRRIQNTPYRVHELRYAIFPQETGQLVIPEMVFSASEVVNQRSVFNLPGRGKSIRKQSNTHIITVNDAPRAAGSALWLPAQALSLSETWSADPDQVRVGDSISRSVLIDAEGLLHSQLPPTQFPQLDNANVYPDQAQSTSDAEGETVLSNRTDSVAIIPTSAGPLRLPAITLSWWNTSTNQLEQAVIPEQTLQIKPAIANNQGNSTPLAVDHSTAIASTAAAAKPTAASSLWQLSTALFAAAWLVTLILWWRRRPLKVAPIVTTDSSHSSEKSAFKALKKVCADNNVERVRAVLLSWGQSHWPQQRLNSLSDIVSLAPTLKAPISALNSDRYGPQASASWQGQTLLQAVQQIRVGASEPQSQTDLAPLYN